MRTRFCLMSAGQKKGKGVLTAHRDWPHSIQLPAGLAGLQHRPDLWRSQICPSPSGQGPGISSEPPTWAVRCGPRPLPSPPGPAYSAPGAYTWLAFGLARTPLLHSVQIGPARSQA